MDWETLKHLVAQGATLVDVQFSNSETVYSYLALDHSDLNKGDYVLVLNGSSHFGVAIVREIQTLPRFDKTINYMPIVQKLDQAAIEFWRQLCN
jgi:hypothetical protein